MQPLESMFEEHVPQDRFREAMSRVCAAVHVITTDGPAGQAGFTASAVCSVTDAPPTLLVCLNRGASASPAVHANGVLCVNVLSEGQHEISNLFGGKTPMRQRFEAARWAETASGAPRLEGALVAFDCRIVNAVDIGTHAVMFCQVIGIHEGALRNALLYYGRAYHGLRLPDDCAPVGDSD
jgi:flavin reductase